MPSARGKDKKAKNKLLKIDMSSGSDDDSEHELSYYAKDKVKLMKEVLKLIKPKKIKSMAPDCIKNLDIVEINSMLLEELLGISNKRLQYIFNGEPADRETSSSESEEEKQPIDVISLDDISDDDDIELCISQSEKEALEAGLSKKKKHKSHKIKTEPGGSAIKLENVEKSKKDNKKKSKKVGESSKQFENLKESEKEKLMSVLELLELQARARAIRSQLAIETDKKGESSAPKVSVKQESDSDSDAVIVDTPQHKEIVITSESEDESLSQNKASSADHSVDTEIPPQKKQKITEQDSAEPSTATKQENETADAYKEIDTVDLTEQESESDLKSRKEKLLTKIQKIKLIRNRNLSCIDQPKNKSDTINCPESSNDALIVEKPSGNTETPPVVDLHESTDKVSEDKSENSKENSEQKADCVIALDEASSSKENESGNKSSENVDKVEEASKHLPSKKQNITDCDNDEIVIDLDEDEMDDMEND